MELASGRIVGSKDSTTSAAAGGGGRGSSNSGRGGGSSSTSVRDRDYARERGRGGGGGGGALRDSRDDARDRDGGGGGGIDWQSEERRRGSDTGSSSRARGDAGRYGSGKVPRGGGGGDAGYRQLGYRQRDRSRSPVATDRNKRARVTGSPTDTRGAGTSSSSRRESKDKDKDRPRSRDSGGSGGGEDGSQRSGSGGRRLADLVESSSSTSALNGAGGTSYNYGGENGNGADRRRSPQHQDGAFPVLSGHKPEGHTSTSAAAAGGAVGGPPGRSSNRSPYANGDAKVNSASGGDRGKRLAGETGEEEGELVFSSSSASPPSAAAPGGGGKTNGDRKGVSSDSGVASADGRRSPPTSTVGGGGESGAGLRQNPRSKSPAVGMSNGVRSGGGGAGNGMGAAATAAAADLGVETVVVVKKVGKDRWADSDSEDEDDKSRTKGDKTSVSEASGAASLKKGGGSGGLGSVSGAGKGLHRGDASAEAGGGGLSGKKDRNDSGEGPAGGAEGSRLAEGVDDLHRAMAGGGDKKGPASGASDETTTADGKNGAATTSSAAAGGPAAEDGGGGKQTTDGAEGAAAGAAAGSGESGAGVGGPSIYRNGARDAPMTVFTRHKAMQDTYNPLLYGCRSVDNYSRVTFIDEGAYGKVYCALNKSTGEVVALKQVKLTQHNGKEGFPITALRETNVLLSLHHPNIVRVLEMVVGSTLDKVYMVMEYFDHDLKSVMRLMKEEKRSFSLGQVKSLVQQLLLATEYMHRHWYIHRDLKTSNLLYNHQGKLAVCDFGLARKYEDPIRPYTFDVVTQWYRCPELLLGQTTYSTGVDMWSVGCIFGELVKGSPMFMGKTSIDQLAKIFGVLGMPTEDRWPGWSKLPVVKKVSWRQGTENTLRATFPATGFSGHASISAQGLDLMNGLLGLDPARRISAAAALKHPWFTQESPAPTPIGQMPQVDSKLDRNINKALADWTKARSKEQLGRGGR